MMFAIVSIDLANVITTTLLHSIWQITIIAGVFKYAKDKAFKDNSIHISQFGMGMLLLTLASTVFTFLYCYGNAQHWLESGTNDAIALMQFTSEASEKSLGILTPDTNNQWINNMHLHITITWLLGVIILMGRIVWGYFGLQRIKRTLNYVIPAPISESFIEISQTLKLSKKVLIATSDRIDIPMVFGHLKPIIVLPLATLNQLSPKEVEFIIAHELGHVLRNDYLQNLILIASESLFFYHPLIWWMTNEIKQSREHHCDEISIECFPDRMEYAKSLLKIESLPHKSNRQLSLALFTKKPLLMNRIKRILKQPVSNTKQFSSSTGIGVVILFIGLFVGASWISKENNSTYEEMNLENEVTVGIESNSATSFLTRLDTIKPNDKEIKEAQARIEELQEEIRIQQKEKLSHMQEIKDQFEAQMKEEKEELKVLKRKYRTERNKSHSQRNRAFSKRNHQKLEENLEELGERMENWMEDNGEEWEANIEALGERLSETFDEEWVAKMEIAAESFGEEFDEDWRSDFQEKVSRLQREIKSEDFTEGIAEFSEAMTELGTEIGLSVAEAMQKVNFEDLEYDIEFGEAEGSDNLKLTLGKEMAEDFELKKGKNKLRLTKDQLIVNGSRANNELLQKYKEIVQENISSLFEDEGAVVKLYFFGIDIHDSDKTNISIRSEN